MCHRRTDWSRTSSRASESNDEREEERAPWTARAKDRLATFVAPEEEKIEEPPEKPMVETETTGSKPSGDAEEPETEDEREEEPIPADD